jgi:hypothetical protein
VETSSDRKSKMAVEVQTNFDELAKSMIKNDNRLLDRSCFFSVASRASGFKFSVVRENFQSPGASGRVYSHAL